jgi:hypothetical protein
MDGAALRLQPQDVSIVAPRLGYGWATIPNCRATHTLAPFVPRGDCLKGPN